MRIGCTCDRGLEHASLRGVPYSPKVHCPACWAFWHRREVNEGRGGDGAIYSVGPPRPTGDFCIYREPGIVEIDECNTCKGRIPVPLYNCSLLHKTCYTGPYTVTGSQACARCQHKTLCHPRDPKCGVVIGMYRWPSLAELQIKLIRKTCGPVPILISDDSSSPDRQERARRICHALGAQFTTSPERIGHVGGDIAAFHNGVQWGKEQGLDVIAKLSQRLLMTRVRWLQDGARELLESGLPAASRKCEGAHHYVIRSEAVLLNLPLWSPDMLPVKRYNPDGVLNFDSYKDQNASGVPGGRFHTSGEDALLGCIPGGRFWPLSYLGEDRFLKSSTSINHWANPLSDYLALAKELGVTLDPDILVEGWNVVPEPYSYG